MGYLAALASSNLLAGCNRDDSATSVRRTFNEPTILAEIRVDSGVRLPVPDTAHDPQRGPYEDCSSGYLSIGDPELDVLRLGALCGAVNAMQAAEPSVLPNFVEAEARHRVLLTAGQCARIILAERGTGPRTLEVEWWRSGQLLSSCEHSSWGLCPKNRALCVDTDADLEIVLRTNGRIDSAAAQVWITRSPGARGGERRTP